MSLFGKKTTDKERRERGNEIRFTGGRIDDIVSALVNSAADKEQKVEDSIVDSLRSIGKHQHDLVVSTCLECINKKKPSENHKIILYRVMHLVMLDNLQEVEEELSHSVLLCAANEMTCSKDIRPELMNSACDLMVKLSHRFDKFVIDELLNRFEPGKTPPYFVMKAIGEVAVQEPIAFMRRISELLKRAVPVMGSVKQDNMKWVFAATMGHVAEAVKYYAANYKEEDGDKAMDTKEFGPEMYGIFDYVSLNWLPSKESQIRLASIEALGHIAGVLSLEHFSAAVPRTIPVLLALYRKERNLLPITQGMCLILERANDGPFHLLEPFLATMLTQLHQLICMQVPGGTSTEALKEAEMVMKTQKESLRCIELITMKYTAQVIPFLLGRLDDKIPTSKVASLTVLKHLISRLDVVDDKTNPDEPKVLEGIRSHIVSGVRVLVDDPSLQVRVALAQLAITMASQRYLLLEGGSRLVDFIVSQSSLTDAEIRKLDGGLDKKKKGPTVQAVDGSVSTWAGFRDMCDAVLNLLTTTLPHMTDVLWPHLLTVFAQSKYLEGTAIVARCLSDIAARKRDGEADDYLIDFDKVVNIPKQHAILARCFSLLSLPAERNNMGLVLLAFLQNMSGVLHPALEEKWDDWIPKFIKYLEAHLEGDWNQVKWENQLLRWISESIDTVGDDEWTSALAEALITEFGQYTKNQQHYSDYRRMVLRYLGKVLAKTKNVAMVRKGLEFMLQEVDHSNQEERVGCASGIGYLSSTAASLDVALDKLNTMTKNDMVRKSTGFLGLSKDKTVDEVANLTCTVVLSYGYITACAPPALVTSRIEIHILPNLMPLVVAPPKMDVKENLLLATALIGQALHPAHLGRDFGLRVRDDLLSAVIKYIAPGMVAKPSWLSAQAKAALPDSTMVGTPTQRSERSASSAPPASPAASAAISVLENLITLDMPQRKLCVSMMSSRQTPLAESKKEAPKPKTSEKEMSEQTAASNLPMALRVLGLRAAKSLLALEPNISLSESEAGASAFLTLTKFLELTLPVRTITHGQALASGAPESAPAPAPIADKEKKDKAPEPKADPEAIATATEFLECMSSVFTSVLTMDCTAGTLADMLCILMPQTQSKNPIVRERACELAYNVLQEYIDIKTGEEPSDATVFTNAARSRLDRDTSLPGLGLWVGHMIPRLTDASLDVRTIALDCLERLLYVDSLLRTAGSTGTVLDASNANIPDCLDDFDELRESCSTSDPQELFSYISRVNKILCEVLQPACLTSALAISAEGLLDPEASSANGAVVIFHGLIKERGQELKELVPDLVKIIKTILSKLDPEKNAQTLQGVLHATRALALHHRDVLVQELLKTTMPFTDKVTDLFQCLSKVPSLLKDVLSQLMEILNTTPCQMDRADKGKKDPPTQYATRIPMAATAAFAALMKTPEMEEFCKANYAELFSTIILRVGSTAGVVQDPKDIQDNEKVSPSEQALDALAAFIACTKDDEMAKVFTPELKEKLKHAEDYAEAIMPIVECVCIYKEAQMQPIFKFVSQFNNREIIGMRAITDATVAVFVKYAYTPLPAGAEEEDDEKEIVRECDTMALQGYLNCLLANAIDKSKIVRVLCMRGLGYLDIHGEGPVNKFANAAISALLGAFEDEQDPIIIEAMTSLGKLAAVVSMPFVAQMLHSICQRVTKAFESENADIRRASISLFGALHRFGVSGDASTSVGRNAFMDHVHNNIPSLVLHIKDAGAGVTAASKHSLRQLSPLIGSVAFDEIVHETDGMEPTDDAAKLDYEAFILEVAKVLNKQFTERARDYLNNTLLFFTSKWDELKAASASFAGYLMAEMDQQNRKQLSVESLSRQFINLLKEKNATVRLKAALAMSLLHEY